MNGRAFFDTNVLLYMYSSADRVKQSRAREFYREYALSGAAHTRTAIENEEITVSARARYWCSIPSGLRENNAPNCDAVERSGWLNALMFCCVDFTSASGIAVSRLKVDPEASEIHQTFLPVHVLEPSALDYGQVRCLAFSPVLPRKKQGFPAQLR